MLALRFVELKPEPQAGRKLGEPAESDLQRRMSAQTDSKGGEGEGGGEHVSDKTKAAADVSLPTMLNEHDRYRGSRLPEQIPKLAHKTQET